MLWSNGLGCCGVMDRAPFFKSLNALGLLGQQRNGCMDLGWVWAARFGGGVGVLWSNGLGCCRIL